jgi:hypothetical protein
MYVCTRTHTGGFSEACTMLDLFFLTLTAVFFGACLAYLLACRRL